MNEKGPHAARMVNSADPRILNGAVGALVTTGVPDLGHVVYQFPGGSAPNSARIVTVPESNRLDPGNRDFVVTVTFKTSQSSGNMVQKGQSGGYFFKVENHVYTTCLFRGTSGSIAASSGRRLYDGKWHTIRCERSATGVSMMVDGKFTDIRKGPTGTIDNLTPLTIGGKGSCNGITVGCDYFQGRIDRVQIDAR